MDTRRHRLENGLLLGTAVSQGIPPGYFIGILAVSPGEPEWGGVPIMSGGSERPKRQLFHKA
jgi:hypothetical protein